VTGYQGWRGTGHVVTGCQGGRDGNRSVCGRHPGMEIGHLVTDCQGEGEIGHYDGCQEGRETG